MWKFVVGVLAALSAQVAFADEKPLVLGVHLGTFHTTGTYNNINTGVYGRFNSWTVGGYHNSIRRPSYYLAYTWEVLTPRVPLVESIAITAGAITGYESSLNNSGVLPMLVPSAAFRINPKVLLRLSILPIDGQKLDSSGAALHFSLEHPLQ